MILKFICKFLWNSNAQLLIIFMIHSYPQIALKLKIQLQNFYIITGLYNWFIHSFQNLVTFVASILPCGGSVFEELLKVNPSISILLFLEHQFIFDDIHIIEILTQILAPVNVHALDDGGIQEFELDPDLVSYNEVLPI